MKIKLYHSPRACSRVTMNALEEANLEYADQVINIFKGEQKSPDYLAIHPGGKVPALDVDGNVITENASILLYLHGRVPEAKLLPDIDDDIARAQQISDLVWCSGTLHPMVRQVRAPMRYTDGDTSGVQQKGHDYLHGVAAQVNERVANGRRWYGDDWSIIDVYLFWLFTTAASAGFPVADYADLVALIERVQARPSFERALERETKAAKAAGIELA